MTDSPEQSTIYSWLTSASGHASIRACAGSGKTTTLVGLCNRIAPNRRSVFLAFNKNIADELKSRLPFYVQSSTFHSCCFDALKRHFNGRIKVDDKKVKWHLRDLLPNWGDRIAVEEVVLALVGYAKSTGYGCNLEGQPTLSDLADYYSLDAGSQHFDLAERLLERSFTETSRIDFDDMLWLALRHNVCFDKANFLLVDEAQDTNVVQAALLGKMLADDGRLIIVGDPNQAIYGFRGAGVGAMEEIEKRFEMTQFPLSVSYRCSVAVVEEANRVLNKKTKLHARHGIINKAFDQDVDINPLDEDRFEQEPL